MSDRYPQSLEVIGEWAARNGMTARESRHRYAQYLVLCAVATSRLRPVLVFKGGNALDFVLQPNRSTVDLDFSFDMDRLQESPSADVIRSALAPTLQQMSQYSRSMLVVHAVHANPRGAGKTFVTLQARVGYALPDEPALLARMRNGQSSPHVVPVEMSVNEWIHSSTEFSIDPRFGNLRISTLVDIVGEKLRAILQQPVRNRSRAQDFLDIAVVLRSGQALDRDQVAEALLQKAAVRNVLVSRAAFRDPEIAARSAMSYAGLEPTVRVSFIPFDEALAIVLAFVDELPIPQC